MKQSCCVSKKEHNRLVCDYGKLSGRALQLVRRKIKRHVDISMPKEGELLVLFCVESVPRNDPVLIKLRSWIDEAVKPDSKLCKMNQGKFYKIDLVSNSMYKGIVCEAVKQLERGRWSVRLLGMGTLEKPMLVSVIPESVEAIDEAHCDECPVCLDPVGERGSMLMC